MNLKLMTSLVCTFVLSTGISKASTTRPQSEQAQVRDIYKQYIEVQSGFSTGSSTPLVEATVKRLKDAGFSDSDIFVGGAAPKKANLVVRYRGTGELKPILLLAHTDVVEAKQSDWQTDPFQLVEKDGYFYGRGTHDDKAQAAIWIANLIQYKKEGFKPNRDIIVALTADEEGSSPYNGVEWLLKNHKELIDADFALNEGGWGDLSNGKRLTNNIQVSEKYVLDFRIEVLNKGGHSSLPTKDNAIYQLANALKGISKLSFPFETNEVTANYLKQKGAVESGSLKAELLAAAEGSKKSMKRLAKKTPQWNATLHTTCIPTLIEGGHAKNALPQIAAANINCRVMPDDSPESVQQALEKAIHNPQVKVIPLGEVSKGPSSPLRNDLLNAVTEVTHRFWPTVTTVPVMVMGATDGRFLRAAGIQTYGVSGFFIDKNDVRAHGRDERISVEVFYEGHAFLYELVKRLSTGKQA